MNDEINKDKVKLQEITDEIDSLKRFVHELTDNSQGDKIENYINKLEKDIFKAQDKLETLYINK